MRHLAIFLITLGLVVGALGQALPDNPAPPPDPNWSHLQSLVYGQPIVVDNTSGPPVHCFFGGITDAYLFCNPPGNPAGVGFRFSRADVLGVDLDLPRQTQTQVSPPERNYHPAWISSMIASGILVGLCATRSTDAGNATKAGFIGAGIVGLIGAPLAFLPHPEETYGNPVYPQYGMGTRLRVPIRPHPRLPRLH